MGSTDMLGLTGKVGIVWGGGFGMGERSSLRLSEAGAKVAVVDIVPERAEKVAAEIVAQGGAAVALSADVTDEPAVERALAAAEAALGPVDVMITVIGIGVWSQLIDMTLEQWDDAYTLYHRPATRFVAGFVGTLNILEAKVENRAAGTVRLGSRSVNIPPSHLNGSGDSAAITVALRPEALSLSKSPSSDVALDGRVTSVNFLGSVIRTRMDVEGQQVSFDMFNNPGLQPPQICEMATAHFKASDVLVIPN